MKFMTILVVSVLLISVLLTGCSEGIQGTYKWRRELDGTLLVDTYDFNNDGSVVWTGCFGNRGRGTYVIDGRKVILTIPDEMPKPIELVRQGDALVDGQQRFERQ